jgi:hypothetical protein
MTVIRPRDAQRGCRVSNSFGSDALLVKKGVSAQAHQMDLEFQVVQTLASPKVSMNHSFSFRLKLNFSA